MECASSKATVNQLDNPDWPKASHQARTEIDAYRGNEICRAQGKANDHPLRK
jgi:hypothetical protein